MTAKPAGSASDHRERGIGLVDRSTSKPFRRLGRTAIFLLPGLAVYLTFLLGPMIYAARLSFYDWNIVNSALSKPVGLDNYSRALSNQVFRRAVLNTIAYTLVTVPGQIVLGVGVASLLNQAI